MDTFVNYEDGKIHFSMPKGWSLISGQDKPPSFRCSYSPNVQEAISHVSQKMPKADVVVFPSGGNIIPRIA